MVITQAYAADFNDLISKHIDSSRIAKEKQSICIKDVDGKVYSHNNTFVVPASVSKIYVTDFALSKFSAHTVYETKIKISDGTIYINGGGNPYFLKQHLYQAIAQANNTEPITHIKVSGNFYYAYATKRNTIKNYLLTDLRGRFKIVKAPTIQFVDEPFDEQGGVYVHRSAPLFAILRRMNEYSNNALADLIMNISGGVSLFREYMVGTYIEGDKTSFISGSGLYQNITTCHVTLDVLESLYKKISTSGLSPADIFAIPAVDEGPLKNRFIEYRYNPVFVGKTGHLANVNSLAGIVPTQSSHPIYFAAFITFKNPRSSEFTKSSIDLFVRSLLNTTPLSVIKRTRFDSL